MSLVISAVPRTFECKVNNETIQLTDPDPNMSPSAVLNFYANTYPSLTTAKVSGPVSVKDTWQYKFESVMGTKG
jgi:PRTRC genetic system protein C